MEKKRIPGRSAPVCYRLRRQRELLEGEQNWSLPRALCAQGVNVGGFFSPKLFINPFHPLKMDFHLKKVQNLEVPTQHILQALLQPLQFVFWCDSGQRLVILSLPPSLADLGASHTPECWWCANSTSEPQPSPIQISFSLFSRAVSWILLGGFPL